jgi:hypothetical protein
LMAPARFPTVRGSRAAPGPEVRGRSARFILGSRMPKEAPGTKPYRSHRLRRRGASRPRRQQACSEGRSPGHHHHDAGGRPIRASVGRETPVPRCTVHRAPCTVHSAGKLRARRITPPGLPRRGIGLTCNLDCASAAPAGSCQTRVRPALGVT